MPKMNEGTACIILKVEENRLHIRYKIKDEIGACVLSIGEWLTKMANMYADMLGEELDTGTNPRLDTCHSSFGPRPCRRPIDVRREACCRAYTNSVSSQHTAFRVSRFVREPHISCLSVNNDATPLYISYFPASSFFSSSPRLPHFPASYPSPHHPLLSS